MRTCRPTVGSAPSRLVTSPRRYTGPSRPTSQTASPWAAQWACGSLQLESDQQSSQPHLHKDPKRYRRWLCVAQYCRPTAPSWAAQWACGSRQLESDQQSSQLLSTSHQSGIAFVVLNAGTAGREHLSHFSIGTGRSG